MRSRSLAPVLLCVVALVAAPAFARGGGGHGPPLDLHVLVTNDDGFDSEGIEALADALAAAGHRVTVVGPAEQQSGKGGSINTGVLDFTPGEGTRMLVNVLRRRHLLVRRLALGHRRCCARRCVLAE